MLSPWLSFINLLIKKKNHDYLLVGSREENDANEIVKNNDMRRKKWIDFYIVWNWEKKSKKVKWREYWILYPLNWLNEKMSKKKRKKNKGHFYEIHFQCIIYQLLQLKKIINCLIC